VDANAIGVAFANPVNESGHETSDARDVKSCNAMNLAMCVLRSSPVSFVYWIAAVFER
jgi:hypothetical protein